MTLVEVKVWLVEISAALIKKAMKNRAAEAIASMVLASSSGDVCGALPSEFPPPGNSHRRRRTSPRSLIGAVAVG